MKSTFSLPLLLTALCLTFPILAAAEPLQLRWEEAGGATDVPSTFIYDPLKKTTLRNSHALQSSAADAGVTAAVSLPAKGSFTLEAFVKPLAATSAAFVKKTRLDDSASECGLRLFHFHAHNQFYLRGYLSPTKGKSIEPGVGYYNSSAQWQGEKDTAWRHVAVVVDVVEKTVTSYVDYYLSSTEPLTQDITLDAGQMEVGGRNFVGLIDEVRVVPQALRPAHFLRAVAGEMKNVSFESGQQILPMDSGAVDVKEHFGAVGDGKTDDTAAFNRAFDALCSRIPLAYHTLLVPSGTYLISDVVQGGRFIDVKGAGPGKTTLKLKDGVFTDVKQPRPILRMSSTRGPSGSEKAVNGSSISVYLEGLTLDTGKGNPGARGIEYHSNNLGRLENVVILSGDGSGVCGLDLTHHDCGPSLVKNVRVEGFDYGVQVHYQEYSMTFENIALRGQKLAGILNKGNILAIRRLKSENTVPAIISEGGNSMVTLLDSTLGAGSKENAAIQAEGALYALRVKTTGYGKAIAKRIQVNNQKPVQCREETVAGPDLDEYVGDQPTKGFGAAKGGLKLSIEETPDPALQPVTEWVSVVKFADRKQGEDWSPAVQAAIESGARTLYFPTTQRYQFHTPIRLHGKVERLVGLAGELHWHSSVWKDKHERSQMDTAAAPPPLLIFDDPNPKAMVILDRLGCVHIQHASPGTLVLRSSTPNRYSTAKVGGRLFAEDVGGADWHFDHPQRVWVRQWNPESHAAGPCVYSKGATIWSLGFKTEYESQKLLAEAGASTELLGCFIYPIGKIPADRPIFENRDSRLALVFGTSVYSASHKIQIRDVQGTEVKELTTDGVKWAGSRGRVDLYSSH